VSSGPGPRGDGLAADLRGFGPIGIVAIAAILAGNFLFMPLSALLVLAWARASQTPWSELGFRRPKNWAIAIALGVMLGIALKLVMKSIVLPLLGADPINHAFHYLVGNPAVILETLFAMIVGAGFGEEVLFRGYAFERLGRLMGSRPVALAATVVLTSVVFGLAHYAVQGLAGVQQATIVGLVLGAIYAVSRSLWLPMIAHAVFDLTAYWIIYHDLETEVAHWFFK
jgi:membrane protease YdiL (CAAX protease family)